MNPNYKEAVEIFEAFREKGEWMACILPYVRLQKIRGNHKEGIENKSRAVDWFLDVLW